MLSNYVKLGPLTTTKLYYEHKEYLNSESSMLITKMNGRKILRCKNISLFRNANYQITLRDIFSCNGFRLLLLGSWVTRMRKGHPFSKYAKFSEKLTFLTP